MRKSFSSLAIVIYIPFFFFFFKPFFPTGKVLVIESEINISLFWFYFLFFLQQNIKLKLTSLHRHFALQFFPQAIFNFIKVFSFFFCNSKLFFYVHGTVTQIIFPEKKELDCHSYLNVDIATICTIRVQLNHEE